MVIVSDVLKTEEDLDNPFLKIFGTIAEVPEIPKNRVKRIFQLL